MIVEAISVSLYVQLELLEPDQLIQIHDQILRFLCPTFHAKPQNRKKKKKKI